MIQRVWEQAGKARSLDRVWVATDDERIFQAVEEFGGQAILTGEAHASGTDRVAEVAQGLECDVVVNLQGDEPLMPPENIDLVTRPFLEGKNLSMSTLMMPFGPEEDIFDPNIVKVVVDEGGRALYFSRAPIPYDREAWVHLDRRCPTSSAGWYKHIGLYAYRRSFLLDISRLPPSRLETLEKLEQLRVLEAGHTIQVLETHQRSLGVDSPADIARVERSLDAMNATG